MIRNVDKDNIDGEMELIIKELLKMIIGMDMEKCVGRMEGLIKVSGRMD